MTCSLLSNLSPKEAARQYAQQILKDNFKYYKPTGLFTYTNEDGAPAFYKFRLELKDRANPPADDGKPLPGKVIRSFHYDGNEWKFSEPKFDNGTKPLYRLQDLSRSSSVVLLVEGEQKADALLNLGLTASTTGGATSIDGFDYSPLKDRHIILWPDFDEPGGKWAKGLMAKLERICNRVEVIDSAALGLQEKGDVIDWLVLNSGATSDAVLNLPRVNFEVEHFAPTDDNVLQKPFFSTSQSGVYFNSFNDDGELKNPEWICSPLLVRAYTRSASNDNWGRLLEWADKDGVKHAWACPMSSFAGDGQELRAKLLNEGLQIAPGARARQHLATYIQTQTPEDSRRARCVSSTGWQGSVFILPSKTINEGTDLVVFQSEAENHCNVSQQGTLDEWRKNVAKLVENNSRHVFAISCAFAAPLLSVINQESGGFHIRGNSSGGKSTAQNAAASVFGDPRRYKKTWRATDNGLEGVAAAHNDLLLLLDEIKQVDEKKVGEIAYMLANGQGKQRMNKNAGSRQPFQWRLLFLSSGELSLSDLMQQGGKRTYAGQNIRMADIPADAGKGLGTFDSLNGFGSAKELADLINQNAGRYFGAAGLAYLEQLAPNVEQLAESIKAMQKEFLSEALPAGASEQAQRVGSRFALVAIAGELATHYGLTGWPEGHAEWAAKECFSAWLEAFGGAGNHEEKALLSSVRAFIEANGDSRFQVIGENSPVVRDRVGFKGRQLEDDPWTYYVLPEQFKRELCKGFDAVWAAKVLASAGMVELDKDGKATKGKKLPDLGLKRVYWLRLPSEE